MKIFLTYDYELFFGSDSGTVEKCMLHPTRDLFERAEGKDVYYTFFVDVGYLITAEKYSALKTELDQVKRQIGEMIERGHDVQLHIHPHWEKAEWKDGRWVNNVAKAYRLSDFDEIERSEIIRKYKSYLENLIGRRCRAFRAGGWCIQPFEDLKSDFKNLDIRIDSSVIPGDLMITDNYFLDFRNAPRKSKYQFEDDVCAEFAGGSFTEYPISSLRYSPLFFWKLYILGRLFPAKHKMIGDGQFIGQGERKKRLLMTYSTNHVSSDGYFANKLETALQKSINIGNEEMVVIGHPKGNTLYSLDQLNRFILTNYKKHSFTSFERELENN